MVLYVAANPLWPFRCRCEPARWAQV